MRRLLLLGFVISAPCYAGQLLDFTTTNQYPQVDQTSTIITETIRGPEYNSGFLYSKYTTR